MMCMFSVFLCIGCPIPQKATLFPYTTLFRSRAADGRRRNPATLVTPIVGGAALNLSRDRRPPRRIENPNDDDTQGRSEEHTSELQSPCNLVCRLQLEKKNKQNDIKDNIEEDE